MRNCDALQVTLAAIAAGRETEKTTEETRAGAAARDGAERSQFQGEDVPILDITLILH